MAIFGSFIGLQSILYAELIAHLCYFVLEVGFDSTMIVSWIHSCSTIRWNFSYSLRRVCVLTSYSSILVRHVFREAISTVDFLAN